MGNEILRVGNLSVELGGKRILAGVSLRVLSGEVVCVLGPNGAGKTTLLKAVAGVVKIPAGKVKLLGKDVARMSRREIAKLVAVVPQRETPRFPFSVKEYVAMGRYPHTRGFFAREDDGVVTKVLREMGLEEMADKPVTVLSGGEFQRVLLARAFVQQPKLLLLDEPTSNLDIRYQLEIINIVRRKSEEGVGVVFVTHDIGVAMRVGDRVVIMKGGRIVCDGSLREILNPRNVSTVFEVGAFYDKDLLFGRRVTVVLPHEDGGGNLREVVKVLEEERMREVLWAFCKGKKVLVSKDSAPWAVEIAKNLGILEGDGSCEG